MAQHPTTTYTLISDREVAIAREFHAPKELVWDVWTKPEHLPHWMTGPDGWVMSVCKIDLRPEGKFRYVWSRQDGSEMQITGTYKEIDPPVQLVNTESWGGEWPDTVDALVLTEENGVTTATLTILYPSKEKRDAALQTGMKDGLNRGYDRLDDYLGTLTATGYTD